MDRSTFNALLDTFKNTLENQMNTRAEAEFPRLNEMAKAEGRRGYNEIGHDEGGARFVRIWTDNGGQKSVRYFVEKDTGIIFGAKGWKAYNPVHEYGTLETVNEWDWSDYYAKSLTGKTSLVPKTDRK